MPSIPHLPLMVRGEDLRNLRDSGITDRTIALNYLRTEDDGNALAEILNRVPDTPRKQPPYFCQFGGLVFPYRDISGRMTGFARVRPHHPRTRKGKPSELIRYEQPRGVSPCRAYFPVHSLHGIRNATVPLFVTEGEKKALALSQLGLAAVGIGGVWCWKVVEADELIPDLCAIPLQGRTVYVVFDFDEKPKARAQSLQSTLRLARALLRAGAKEVCAVELPSGPRGTKLGVDDFLVANGPQGKERFTSLVKEALPVGSDSQPLFANFTLREVRRAGKPRTVRVGRTAEEIRQSLCQLTGGWPKRVGELLFVRDGYQPLWLERTDSVFAWIGAQLDQPVQWVCGSDKVSRGVFHAHLQHSAERYEAVETLPHSPPLSGHFYLHPEPRGGNGGSLQALLNRFCPASDIDRDLIHAALLTPFWGGAPGSRPAFLIESDDDGADGRGTGKSTLAKAVAHLAGGAFGVRAAEDMNSLMTRLLTPAALSLRVALLDNVKTLKFSWAELEGLITADTVSGRRLYTGEGRRPNTLTWLITLNNASLSKDLAQRCVIVRLNRPAPEPDWEAATWAFMDENRWEIVGDLLAELGGEKAPLPTYSRWAAWEQEVLACVSDPVGCQSVIAERQGSVDGDQEDSDHVRGAFATTLRQHGHDPDREIVFITSSEAAEIVNEATGEKRPTNKASAYLNTLCVPELRKSSDAKGARGWRWAGKLSKAGQSARPLNSRIDIGPHRLGPPSPPPNATRPESNGRDRDN